MAWATNFRQIIVMWSGRQQLWWAWILLLYKGWNQSEFSRVWCSTSRSECTFWISPRSPWVMNPFASDWSRKHVIFSVPRNCSELLSMEKNPRDEVRVICYLQIKSIDILVFWSQKWRKKETHGMSEHIWRLTGMNIFAHLWDRNSRLNVARSVYKLTQ